MDGFKRPNRPTRRVQMPVAHAPMPKNVATPVAVAPELRSDVEPPKPKDFDTKDKDVAPKKDVRTHLRRRRVVYWVVGVVVAATLAVLATYNFLLSPADPAASGSVEVEIVSGALPGQIADMLEESGVIRSGLAFTVHTRIQGIQNNLQAGIYQLLPSDSTPEIAAQLQKGPRVDEIEIMFKPGATLADNKEVLLALGYDASEIDAAFTAQYDHPLFEGRPATSDIEGYIFGETHRFVKGTTVEGILERYFDDYYKVIKENDLVDAYSQQGLSLYGGITLASIVQRESGGNDKAGIAQVFLTRLSKGMQLGSDVTYQYIADKEGNPRDINYDSPYNTRRYTGLPPGPIASPGVDALKAVGSPAEGDYLYFLSGDDGVTYFARSFEEHEANIRNHCQQKCAII